MKEVFDASTEGFTSQSQRAASFSGSSHAMALIESREFSVLWFYGEFNSIRIRGRFHARV